MTDERKQLLAELRTIRIRADEIGRRLAEMDRETEAEREATVRRRAFHVVRAVGILAALGFVSRQVRGRPVAAATGAVALAALSTALVVTQNNNPPLAVSPGIYRAAPPSADALPPRPTTTPDLLPTQRTSESTAFALPPGGRVLTRSRPIGPEPVSVHTPPAPEPPGTQRPAPPPEMPPAEVFTPPVPSSTPVSPSPQPCAPLLELKVAPIPDLRLCQPAI